MSSTIKEYLNKYGVYPAGSKVKLTSFGRYYLINQVDSLYYIKIINKLYDDTFTVTALNTVWSNSTNYNIHYNFYLQATPVLFKLARNKRVIQCKIP